MTVIELLNQASDAFRAGHVNGLLIGGIAVNYHGYSRNTQDVDIMVAAHALADIDHILKAAGFTNIERRLNVVFYRRPDLDFRLDILHVDEITFNQLWSESIALDDPSMSFRVPKLEHLFAMKLFSLKSDWDRRVNKDLPDIANLAIINHVDPEVIIGPLCKKYADEQIYLRLINEIDRIKAASA